MPLQSARLRTQAEAWREAHAVLLYGAGFVTVGSTRVFVPFFGRLRELPSPDEEHRMATAFPRNWQLLIFAFVCLLGARLALEAFALSGALRGLLTPIVILACAAIWWLRQRRIISAWPMASDPRINRTVIALTALEGLPKALVTVNFLLCVGVALWFAFALLHPRPLSDPELWVVVPILAYCIFALLRAARGFGLALMGGAGRQSS